MSPDRARCTARTLGGEPCTHWARPGQTRCRVHSGRELRRAERKLTKLTVPAVERLGRLLEDENGQVALKAVAIVLDRTAGAVPRSLTAADMAGLPAVQIGFALGGLVQAPTPLPLPPVPVPSTPVELPLPEPEPEPEPGE